MRSKLHEPGGGNKVDGRTGTLYGVEDVNIKPRAGRTVET